MGHRPIGLIIVKQIVTGTTTGPCEMSGPTPKFSGVGSKFLCFVYLIVQAQFVYQRTILGGGGGCHSTVKPAKKSFVIVMFYLSVSNLLSHLNSIIHNVFCSFPNSFPKVSVV